MEKVKKLERIKKIAKCVFIIVSIFLVIRFGEEAIFKLQRGEAELFGTIVMLIFFVWIFYGDIRNKVRMEKQRAELIEVFKLSEKDSVEVLWADSNVKSYKNILIEKYGARFYATISNYSVKVITLDKDGDEISNTITMEFEIFLKHYKPAK